MKQFRHLLFTALFCFSAVLAISQPVGEWTDYQSYASAKSVVDTGDKIYCVTEGGLFSYSKTDNSIQKMSAINGLSDAGIQGVAYSAQNNLIFITYQNANIDLLIGNEIFNLSDIKRKQLSADKTINNVLFVGNLAYLSCGFGIVVVNLEKKEIKETYYIGNGGDYLKVFDLATDGNYFYAATENGIYKADFSNPNLQDYNNWIKEVSIPHSNNKFSEIENFKGKIMANYTTEKDDWAGDEIYQLSNNLWIPFLPGIKYVSDVTSNNDYLVFSSREEVFVYDENYVLVKYVPKFLFEGNKADSLSAKSAVLDDKNVLWIADKNNGLIKVGTQTERIVPEGPLDNMIFSLGMNGQDLWISKGGTDASWGNRNISPHFQLKREGKWKVFDRKIIPVLNKVTDIVSVKADPKDPDHIFAASWGGGVLEFRGDQFVKQHNNFNSTLQSELPDTPNDAFVRIGGMDFDKSGNLWVSNSGVSKIVSEFKTDGTWEAYAISGVTNRSIGKIIVTQSDDKWIQVPRNFGLAVLNKDGLQSKSLKVIARFVNSEGEFLNEMPDVFSIAEDLEGEIWVGTSGGVAVYSNPESIWTEPILYATRPGLDLKDGVFYPLLEKESVSAIAVDGANRKWLGTRNSGVFLISPDGETEIEHFNSENSPLPSNDITDIAINQKSGEVFIGTTSGLISYMGEAVEGADEFNDVYVYPNPVRETYSGPIVIKGLVDDTDVKITDISGDLVYKANSLGGQAIWDGKNLNGNRCKTGVYLVFLTDQLGERTKITKLLFIH